MEEVSFFRVQKCLSLAEMVSKLKGISDQNKESKKEREQVSLFFTLKVSNMRRKPVQKLCPKTGVPDTKIFKSEILREYTRLSSLTSCHW